MVDGRYDDCMEYIEEYASYLVKRYFHIVVDKIETMMIFARKLYKSLSMY